MLDLLLTGIGIALIAVGLIVFLTGKRRSGEDSGQNRFDAFGIKIDVANPSMLLVMFGVVLVLAPRVLPISGESADQLLQQGVESLTPKAAQRRQGEPKVLPDTAPAAVAASASGGSEPDTRSSGANTRPVSDDDKAPPEPAADPKTNQPPQPVLRLASADVELDAALLEEAPTIARAEPAGSVLNKQRLGNKSSSNLALGSKASAGKQVQGSVVVGKLATAKPRPPRTAAVASARPSAQVARPAAVVPAAPKPRLAVLVVADADRDAGIKVSADEYADQVGEELTTLARLRVGGDMQVSKATAADLRKQLGAGKEGLESLCKQASADRLLVADLRIPFTLGARVPSAFWPDLYLHAVDCDAARGQRVISRHLEPHRDDTFPFQQSLRDRVGQQWPVLSATLSTDR